MSCPNYLLKYAFVLSVSILFVLLSFVFVSVAVLWEDTIKMDLQEVGSGMDWIELAQGRDR
jgi:hypothetical protein